MARQNTRVHHRETRFRTTCGRSLDWADAKRDFRDGRLTLPEWEDEWAYTNCKACLNKRTH